MSDKHVIFVSAVSREFHAGALDLHHQFHSYRDTLKQAFRTLAPHYEVIVQEDLAQGPSDLLETLDREVARSLVVVHLVGDMAGDVPSTAAVRKLRTRHSLFLATEPELERMLRDEATITYTQWEIYLAFLHGTHRLVFKASPEAPRSPQFKPTPEDRSSQQRHAQRLKTTGAHYGSFSDQGDIARKAMRSFLHFRLDADVDGPESAPEAVDAAWANASTIVNELANAIRKPDPRMVPVTDPANVAAFVGAVRVVAARWHVNLATVLAVANHDADRIRAEAQHRPSPEKLYAQAFSEFALGDFTDAQYTARRAAAAAEQLRYNQREDDKLHRTSALNALLLAHDAAAAAHDADAGIRTLREAAALVDKESEPLLWADLHQQLARFLTRLARYDEALDLVNDVVDVREDRQGDTHPDLADTLLLWSELLFQRADYPGCDSVAARAERIFAIDSSLHVGGIIRALNFEAEAVRQMGNAPHAEALFRRALALAEAGFHEDSLVVSGTLNNLAHMLKDAYRFSESEPLLRRALAIDERVLGLQHPNLAPTLTNLAQCLTGPTGAIEAESLLRRAFAIVETSFGPDHPRVAVTLNVLARFLMSDDRLAEAEALVRRALTINEAVFGANHPDVSATLNNLAEVLLKTDRPQEAIAALHRALAIDESTFGANHPRLAPNLYNLGQLLSHSSQVEESVALMRRAVLILLDVSRRAGGLHPDLERTVEGYASVLEMSGLPEAEIRTIVESLLASPENRRND